MTELILEGALRIVKGLDTSSLTEGELQEVHSWLHRAWQIYTRTGQFNSESDEDWSKEDLWNLHQLLSQTMKEVGLSHSEVDGFDAVKLDATYDGLAKSKAVQIYLVGAREELLDYCDGVMLNAYNLSTKQIQNAKKWKQEGIVIVLDNGAFQSATLTPAQLLEATKLVEADVVCAPDFLYDADSDKKSVEAQREFLSMKPECKVMGIGQGQSAFKFEACIREIIKLNPEIIGIGRKSMQVAGYPGRGLSQRIFALQRLQDLGILDEIKDQGIEIHALGVENPHAFRYFNHYGFSSVDSMSYIFSSLYTQLHHPEDSDEKPFKHKEGIVVPKDTDSSELVEKKQAMFDSFKSLSSLEEKQAYILKNIWLPLRGQVATEEDVRRITEGLSIEQRNDSPVLSKLSEAE